MKTPRWFDYSALALLLLGCGSEQDSPVIGDTGNLGGATGTGGAMTDSAGSVGAGGSTTMNQGGSGAVGGSTPLGGATSPAEGGAATATGGVGQGGLSVGGSPSGGGTTVGLGGGSSSGGTNPGAGGEMLGQGGNAGGAVTNGGMNQGGSATGGGAAGGTETVGGSAQGGMDAVGGFETGLGGTEATAGTTSGGAATGGTGIGGAEAGAGTCGDEPVCNPPASGGDDWTAPGNKNPFVPGYFADGTVKKFGDTFYLYATSDGVKNAAGPPVIWVSHDFVNWYALTVTIPTGSQGGPGDGWAWWAPDVTIGPDGTYYYYHSNNSLRVFAASSPTPTGPFTSLGSIMPNQYVSGVLTLDGQTFTDSDGTQYIYFCTWAASNSGCGWARFNSDMRSFSQSGLIDNAQLGAGLSIGEGPFVMKANDRYYFMMSNGSCFDASYQVRYSVGDSPTGPFTFARTILSTSADDSVNGPGHHSVINDGTNYTIVYHRHDNPHSTGGMFRQQAADRMTFDGSGNIDVVTPTHTGVGYLGPDQNPTCDMAFGRTATASSSYTDTARDFDFLPEYAVDDNNGTLWKAGDSFMGHALTIDLGGVQPIATVMTQFEYPMYYYQYLLEVSEDGSNYVTYADRTDNRIPGSPMVDKGTACARYLRIRITGVEKPGMYAAIFNIRAFAEITGFDPSDVNPASAAEPAPDRGQLLIDLDASTVATGSLSSWTNQGTLGGSFTAEGGSPTVGEVSGRTAVTFSGSNRMRASFPAPASISWNSPYTVAGWFLNPAVGERECLLSWADRGGPQAAYASMMYGTSGAFGASAHWDAMDMPYRGVPSAGAWHHIALVFDGQVERVYVDGTLNNQEQKNLQVWQGGAVILADSGALDVEEHFSGSVASLRMYDVALDATGVNALMSGDEPTLPTPPTTE